MAEAALVEANEEAGVQGVVELDPVGSYRFIKLFDDGGSQNAEAHVYPIRVTALSDEWREMRQRKRRWFKLKKAAASVFETDLCRFLGGLEHNPMLLTTSSAGYRADR